MRCPVVIAFLSAVLALPASGEPAASERVIILFGANWCAPCVEELRELPDLNAIAKPDRLVIAWTDGDARVPPTLIDAGIEKLSLGKARKLLSWYGSGNAGLPLVVMTAKDGTRCAMQRRRLTSEVIAALRKECDANQ